MIADATYYVDIFLMGRDAVIPLPEFLFWEKKARSEVLRGNPVIEEADLAAAMDELKECLCEVAELLYTQGQSTKIGALKSESNDGYSYTLADQTMKRDDLHSEIRTIIRKNLTGTTLHNTLIFRG